MKTLLGIPDQKNRPCIFGPPAPVEILQREWEFERLLDLYRARKPKRVLEVGTYHGGTLYHWLQNATKGANVVSIDSYVTGIDNRHLYAGWVPTGVTLRILSGDSHDPEIGMETWRNSPFDWTFIDAGHYYNEVERDWDIYRQMAADDGVIVLHDIVPQSDVRPEIEVDRLWAEIQAEGYVTQELVANASGKWCGIGIVYLG